MNDYAQFWELHCRIRERIQANETLMPGSDNVKLKTLIAKNDALRWAMAELTKALVADQPEPPATNDAPKQERTAFQGWPKWN